MARDGGRGSSDAPLARPRRSRLRPAVWAALVFAGAVIITLLVSRGVADADERQDEERFAESAEQFGAGLEREIEGYFDELVDIGAFHGALGSVTPGQFERFVVGTGIFERLPALNGIIYLELVSPDELDARVAERQAADPDFALFLLGETPPDRPHLLLTHYVPGRDDLALPRGADVSAITSISDVIAAAGASGAGVTGSFQDDPFLIQVAETTAFPQIDLLLGMDFFIGMPVYAEVDAAPVGWLSAPVDDFDEVLAAATSGLTAELGASLTVDLTGVPDREREVITRVAEREGSAGPLADATRRTSRDFEVDGVPWSLTLWTDETDDQSPVSAVFLGGLLASMLGGLLVYARLRHTDREHAYAVALAEREEFRRIVLESVADPVVVLDAAGRVLDSNPAWARLRGEGAVGSAPPVSAAGADLDFLAVLEEHAHGDVERLRAAMAHVTTGDRRRGTGDPADRAPVEVDLLFDTSEGRRWYAVRMAELAGAPGGTVVVLSEITERKRSEAELALKANHDNLTGLLNRTAIEEELEQAWQRARLREVPVGVLFIDLDGFKPINDTHGHAVGDSVLRAVAQRISGAVRSVDRVARLGGDEFVVLLGSLEDRDGAERTARRVLDALAEPVVLADRSIPVRASVGVAVVDAPLGTSAGTMIDLADQAMYAAKRAGGGTYSVAT